MDPRRGTARQGTEWSGVESKRGERRGKKKRERLVPLVYMSAVRFGDVTMSI